MKSIISLVMSFLERYPRKCVTCKDCRNVSLNDKNVEDVYTEMHYLKEVEYFYCEKQKKYVKLLDEACGEYVKR